MTFELSKIEIVYPYNKLTSNDQNAEERTFWKSDKRPTLKQLTPSNEKLEVFNQVSRKTIRRRI